MLASETESHYCNMFSLHLPHTVLFVSCDVFHIAVAARIFSERKKQTEKNILTKHGQSIHKSPWQMWKYENTLRRKRRTDQSREMGDRRFWQRDEESIRWETSGREKTLRWEWILLFFWPFRNSCLTRCCQRNFKHSGIFIIIIKERKSGHADRRTRTLKKKEMTGEDFCFHKVSLTSLHSPSVSFVDFVEIEKSQVLVFVVQS